MNPAQSLVRNENGAAGAEMALMVPLLVILMFGSFEMGNFFWNEHKVVKAV
jgi:Flp pilus assembly protein TadG